MNFSISETFPASKQDIYNAWLDGESHSFMTCSSATAGTNVGDSFTAFDDYAWGKNLELVPYDKIVQSWRTTEFSDEEEDSIIEVLFEENDEFTQVTINHSKLPLHGNTYKQGWIDYYFEPMKDYFTSKKS
jgi:activator of HSP90 ATPase